MSTKVLRGPRLAPSPACRRARPRLRPAAAARSRRGASSNCRRTCFSPRLSRRLIRRRMTLHYSGNRTASDRTFERAAQEVGQLPARQAAPSAAHFRQNTPGGKAVPRTGSRVLMLAACGLCSSRPRPRCAGLADAAGADHHPARPRRRRRRVHAAARRGIAEAPRPALRGREPARRRAQHRHARLRGGRRPTATRSACCRASPSSTTSSPSRTCRSIPRRISSRSSTCSSTPTRWSSTPRSTSRRSPNSSRWPSPSPAR